MRIKELTVSLGRAERHAKYFMSKPNVGMSMTLDPEDDLREVFEEAAEDLRIMVAEMIEEETRIYEERHGKHKLKSNTDGNEAG